MHNHTFRVGAFCASMLVFCATWMMPQAGIACAIPVFRYALERWTPDPYSLQVYHRGPLDPASRTALSVLTGSEGEGPLPINLQSRIRSEDLPPDLEPFLSRGPVLSIHSPGGGPTGSPLWLGPLSPTILQRIVQSPARTTIQARILSGQTAVFLYLRSGDEDQDTRIYALLEDALQQAERTLDLDDFVAVAGKSLEEMVPPDAPPLKVAFSALAITRRDPAEMFLVTPILRAQPERLRQPIPVVVPIFARGRALPPLVGDDITPAAIQQVCRFLIDACSCEVKAENPGLDLLFASDWGGEWDPLDYQERVLPPLEGVLEPPPPLEAAPTIPTPAPPPDLDRPVRSLLMMLGAVGIGLLAATGWLVHRSHRDENRSSV